MNDREEDKLDMYYAVITACDAHHSAWSDLSAFASAYSDFQALVKSISQAARDQLTGPSGAARQKSRKRNEMAERAVAISGALQAWASVNGAAQIADRAGFSLTDLLQCRDTDAEKRARIVEKDATAIHDTDPAEAEKYGINQARLDELTSAIADYHQVLVAPRSAIIDRKAATSRLKAGIREADKILKERMDNLIPILTPANPRFAIDYDNSRKIVGS